MELLGERPTWSMSGSEMLSTLDQLDAELARLETYRLHLIASLDTIGHAQETGAHDTAQLIEFRYRLDRARARRDVRLATALAKYDAVAAALPAPDHAVDADPQPETVASDAAGTFLRPAQAEVIVSALEQVPLAVPVEDLAVAERELVGLAQHLSPAELRRAGQRVRDVLDTDGPKPEEHKAYARENLTLTTAARGVKFRGYLANENAELLRAVIHANARPHKTIDGELDPRSREKRQADALTTALTIAATTWDTTQSPHPTTGPSRTGASTGVSSDGSAGAVLEDALAAGPVPSQEFATGVVTDRGKFGPVPGFGAKANITVTIDLQDLKAAAADAIGDTVYGDGLSAATIRRLACDARIIPLVLGSNSEPLDVGRSERLVTRPMRHALNARDRGCVVCGAPPIMCDAHHLISWLAGGETKVSNLALLCRRHHVDLHAGDWTITITNGTVHVARPTWADPPRQPYRRPTAQGPTTDSAPNTTTAAPGAGTEIIASRDESSSPRSPDLEALTSPTARANPKSAARGRPSTASTRASTLERLIAPQANPRGTADNPTGTADNPTGTADNPAGTADTTSLRDAACLAIWGELPPPSRSESTHAAPDDPQALDPWACTVGDANTRTVDIALDGEGTATVGDARHDCHALDTWGDRAEPTPPARRAGTDAATDRQASQAPYPET